MENSLESSEYPNNYPKDFLDLDEETLEYLSELENEKGAGILFPIGVILAIIGFIFLLVSLSFLMIQNTTDYEDGYQDATVLVSNDSSINVAKVSLVFIIIGVLFVFIDIRREEKTEKNIENNIE